MWQDNYTDAELMLDQQWTYIPPKEVVGIHYKVQTLRHIKRPSEPSRT